MWNYRIVREGTGEERNYSIREVFYDDDEEINGFTIDPCRPYGENREELGRDFQMMSQAFERDVVDAETYPGALSSIPDVPATKLTAAALMNEIADGKTLEDIAAEKGLDGPKVLADFLRELAKDLGLPLTFRVRRGFLRAVQERLDEMNVKVKPEKLDT